MVSQQLALAPTGGNVGVGTSTAPASLEVAGNSVFRGNASVGGNNQDSVLRIDSQGSKTVGLQLGPDPELPDPTSSGARRLLGGAGAEGGVNGSAGNVSSVNKKSFGVYSLVGGEQVMVKRGRGLHSSTSQLNLSRF